MKFLVIGLGSMGKRRIRNLQALGVQNIYGFDLRSDRRDEVLNKYGINSYLTFEDAMDQLDPNVFIISTPPDLHMHYANIALNYGIDCFIEASVVGADEIRRLSNKNLKENLIISPSCTMQYFPGPKKIKEIILGGQIGAPLFIQYQSGQHLKDWHPWERMEDFYVSNRETGGAREIVPFELTWLNNIFGKPEVLSCHKTKLSNIKIDIDDIYCCLLKYESGAILNLTVEVVSSPKATREMRVLGEKGEIIFSGDSNSVKYINENLTEWVEYQFEHGNVEKGYINPENPYIEEMGDFLHAVKKRDSSLFPNTLLKDADILETLLNLERLS
ncbi:Gfo/Idh/MocA family protein [Polynucleobacter sp. JS-JIR-5-A7]|uniref:Gfo/Idh/MocA family protein n=1 Tax=Polynucleobacter sp. JS-JIR-5-A7 TaxID=1758395 RepID=UPI001BFCE67C|nr:Gfo/Idh/MocA family oxidoreductase [Polynucleobacter sp. JS-JIR-5-A7]QWE06940.1 Gfo/Idh/MocA family oxidoreductase [Polynucleobacter sp. JS-JIR-5-A7]